MEKLNKTQLLTLSLIVTLLSLTPLLSSSFRSTYLYFIINVLILVIGAEAKFHSSSSSSSSSSNKILEGDRKITSSNDNMIVTTKTSCFTSKKVLENSISEKQIIVSADEVKKMIKKSPSTPSMFYIGSGNRSETEVEENVQEEEVYEEEELFVKAETFIGNFYKQLKMQKEESWSKIHGFNENGLIS